MAANIYECFVCMKKYRTTNGKSLACCEVCNDNFICKKCLKEEYYDFNEWINIKPQCDVCKKLICMSCTVFCHDCANVGDEFIVYCDDCHPEMLELVECEYHNWYVCEKHKDKKCGECCSNKNYDSKYSM